jgi:hypothetical protein
MAHGIPASVELLPDTELIARLHTQAARGRAATAEQVACLAEVDVRGLHLRGGYPSLFAYCCEALGLPEHEAYSRIVTARASRRFPVILELLAQGAVNVTTVRLLAPYLTSENHPQVLEAARGKRKLQVEEIAARLAPRPDAPAFVRKLPPPRTARSELAVPPDGAGPPSRPRGPAITPLAPLRYRLQATITGETLEKLRLAKDMLRHAIPSGDDAAILDRALTALLTDLLPRKFAVTDTPRPTAGTAPGSRHIPAEVKRAVWLRDLGRCAFVGEEGRRCRERAFVEFHHVRPYAAGGEATVANVQLRCRGHNAYEAAVYFAGVRSSAGSPAVDAAAESRPVNRAMPNRS